MQYVSVKELPEVVQRQLKVRDYHKTDIGINTVEMVSPYDSGGAGQRGYLDVIDLGTGKLVKSFQGSWGGANCFNPNNQLDIDRSDYPIPVNAIVIQGATGYRPHASLSVGPNNAPQLLPAPTGLDEKSRRILAIYRGITSAYRQEYLERMNATRDDVIKLADDGYLKIAKNGATRITTKGKNACLTETVV